MTCRALAMQPHIALGGLLKGHCLYEHKMSWRLSSYRRHAWHCIDAVHGLRVTVDNTNNAGHDSQPAQEAGLCTLLIQCGSAEYIGHEVRCRETGACQQRASARLKNAPGLARPSCKHVVCAPSQKPAGTHCTSHRAAGAMPGQLHLPA